MADQLYQFLTTLLIGAVGLVDQLFEGVPFAKESILWALFVVLVMNLIVIPIRGYGASDRALAKDVRSGRSLSTKAIKEARIKQTSKQTSRRWR